MSIPKTLSDEFEPPLQTLEINLNYPEKIKIKGNDAGFKATIPDKYDSGLGFQQGSTDGVYNNYSSCGFHRPQHPEFPRNLRRRFNLLGYRGSENYGACLSAYKCHYDPDPFFDEEIPTNLRDDYEYQNEYQNSPTNLTGNNVFKNKLNLLIMFLLATFICFFIYSIYQMR